MFFSVKYPMNAELYSSQLGHPRSWTYQHNAQLDTQTQTVHTHTEPALDKTGRLSPTLSFFINTVTPTLNHVELACYNKRNKTT